MAHMAGWTSYDFLAFYAFAYGGQPYRGSLRAYWLQYPPVTKFALGVSQEVTKRLSAFVRAENLGNNLRTEDYNLNLPVPRSVMVGATFHY